VRLRSALLPAYHAGRLATYAMLGALAAKAGALGAAASMPRALPGLLLGGAAGVFACHALARLAPRLTSGLGGLAVLGHAPPGWTRMVRRFAAAVARPGGGFLLGVALGFLPCGMLYAAIAAAAATGGPGHGALAMLAFGLGTIPGLVAVGIAGQAAGRAWQRMMNFAAPLIMLANAALLAAMAWQRLAGSG
jgi:uncharacterized protein